MNHPLRLSTQRSRRKSKEWFYYNPEDTDSIKKYILKTKRFSNSSIQNPSIPEFGFINQPQTSLRYSYGPAGPHRFTL